jgi:hypothetical protein
VEANNISPLVLLRFTSHTEKGSAVMANQYDDFDDDDEQTPDQNGPANLRKALKRAEKEREALRTELNEFRAERRVQSVKSVLEAEGINPKIAGLMPTSIDTPEAVKAWLTEYGDVFGAVKPPVVEPEVQDNPEALARDRMNNAINTAQGSSKDADLRSLVDGAKTRADLDALTGNLSSGPRRLS